MAGPKPKSELRWESITNTTVQNPWGGVAECGTAPHLLGQNCCTRSIPFALWLEAYVLEQVEPAQLSPARGTSTHSFTLPGLTPVRFWPARQFFLLPTRPQVRTAVA